MKRYMLHLQNTLPYTPKDATSLLHRARELVEPEDYYTAIPVFPKNTLNLTLAYLRIGM